MAVIVAVEVDVGHYAKPDHGCQELVVELRSRALYPSINLIPTPMVITSNRRLIR